MRCGCRVRACAWSDAARVSKLPGALVGAPCVVWDFDGTIADTEPVQAQAYEVVLASRGAEVEPGWFHAYVGSPERVIWARLREAFALSEASDVLMAERGEVFVGLASSLEPAWFVPAALCLPVPHRIVSAGQRAHIVALLDAWGLSEAFASVSAASGLDRVPPKGDRLRAAYVPGAVLFEDMPAYLNLGVGFTTVGVSHAFNDLSATHCTAYVRHDVPGRWQVGSPRGPA